SSHGQGTLAGAIWRWIFERASAGIRKWIGLHLHRIPATFVAGGSFGWPWGRHEIAHRLDTQTGRIVDAVPASDRRRVVFGQRQRRRKLCGRENRRPILASPPGRKPFRVSDLRRRANLFPE